MNKIELVALFTAMDELAKTNNIEGLRRVIKKTLSEAETKPSKTYDEDQDDN